MQQNVHNPKRAYDILKELTKNGLCDNEKQKQHISQLTEKEAKKLLSIAFTSINNSREAISNFCGVMTFLAMLANVHAPPKEADRSKYSIFKEKLCSQFEFLGKFIAAIEYRLIKYGQKVKEYQYMLVSQLEKQKEKFTEIIDNYQRHVCKMGCLLEMQDLRLYDFDRLQDTFRRIEQQLEVQKIGFPSRILEDINRLSWENSRLESITELPKVFAELAESSSTRLLQLQQLEDYKRSYLKLEHERQKLIAELVLQRQRQQASTIQNIMWDSEVIEEDDYTAKKFLWEGLKDTFGLIPRRLRRVYRFDPKHHTPFHDFIDNLENILLLVRLENGNVIGGFCREPFQPGKNGKNGCLFSFKNYEIYLLKKQPATQYDTYYIIFGKSEICIRNFESSIFSNFGIGNSSFDSKSRKVDDFLGYGTAHNAPIKAYEVYTVLQ